VKLITGIDDNGKNTKLLFFFLKNRQNKYPPINQIDKTTKFDTTDKKRYTVSNKYL
jgi:hypothetical protein